MLRHLLFYQKNGIAKVKWFQRDKMRNFTGKMLGASSTTLSHTKNKDFFILGM